MSSEEEKLETIGSKDNETRSNALLMNQTLDTEVRHQILNDYTLMEILDFIEIKDLFRWFCVSKQFFECIPHVLKARKHLIVVESEPILDINCEFGIHLCYDRQHSKTGSDYLKNNIKSAITQKNRIFYLTLDNTFTSITEKCPFIECLALKDCYLDETVFKYLESNLKQLKCISIFQCILEVKAIDLMNKLKTLSQNITHLSIYQIKRLNDKSFETIHAFFGEQEMNHSFHRREILWNFIKLFKNLKKLDIVIESRLGIRRLFSEKIPSLERLDVSLDNPSINTLFINSFVLKTDNISHLKSLDIKDYYITLESLQRITNDMNLKSFDFSCIRLDINLLSQLAEKQKDLNKLSIYWSHFMPYTYVEKLLQFEKVKHFVLNNSPLNPDQFKQIIGLFPSLVSFKFTPYCVINCGIKEEDNRFCRTCLGMCFDSIPRMDSLKRFVVSFSDMCQPLIHSLKGFPHLNCLTITGFWSGIENEDTIKRFNFYFKDIVEYLSDKCRQTPTKAFKLLVWKYIAIPEHIVIPKNFQIVGNSDILYKS